MAMALTPREIQQRIRSGATQEEVAAEAGVEVSQIASFVGPALAERGFYLQQAKAAPLRRAGQTAGHRPLEAVVIENLRRIEETEVEWDAFQLERRRWVISLSLFTVGRQAEFIYEQTGRFSIAHNRDAQWLIGDIDENSPSPQLIPDSPKTIPTGTEASPVLSHTEPIPVPADLTNEPYEPTIGLVPPGDDDAELSDITDAFSEAEFREVNGVLDIDDKQSNTDVIYEILSTLNEDSVRLYAGLVDQQKNSAPANASASATPTVAAPSASNAQIPGISTPTRPIRTPENPETTQPALIDAPAKPPRKKRASIPSWDEIMFGGNPDN